MPKPQTVTRSLPAGVTRYVHVLAKALANNFDRSTNDPIVGIRLADSPDFVLMCRHVEILGPSRLFHDSEKPLPDTNGRGICYLATEAEIVVHTDAPEQR